MSHTSRRGPPPVECPLASLGRNTPSLDTQQFHHPLSSSPLNPEVYQMSRNSPLLTVQSNKIGYSTNHHPTNNVTDGQQMYQLSRSSSSSIDQTYALRNRDLEPKVYRQLPHRNYTPIDSLLSYHERMSPQIVDRSGNVGINCGGNNNKNVGAGGNYLLENRDDDDDDDDDDNGRTEISNMVSINHHNNEYLLEQKMDALYLQGAIRNLPLGGNPVRRQKNPNNNHHSNSNTERYYLEENMEDICHYPSSNRLGSNSPNLLRRASSPSETSGSDRYLIERYRQSPAIIKTNRIAHIKSQDNNLYPNANNNNEQTRYALPKAQLIIDGLSRFGRFSPSLDQGYHTLVSPSPSVPQTPGPWNKKGPCRSGPGFDRLPDDAVLKIFEWLDSCELCNIARVCRRFETLAWNPFLWKNITLRGEHIGGDKALKTIFRRLCGQTRNGACPAVEKVMLSDGCKISDKGMQLLARRCPELTHLQIQFSANVTNLTLFDVVTRCTNLQHLDITGCSQITCININTNLESPRRLLLQYLDLTDCAAISDAGLKVIVRNCPQLVYLYLRRCVQITDAGLKFVPSFCIALRELSVSDCSNITDFGLYELAKLGATLRYLSVAKCDQVSDAGLKVIARRCYKLRYLNARGCEAVSDDSITVLARSCPRLRALDIGKCDVSDAGLRALAESCPNLKKLSLRNCDMITDRGVQCIAYYCRGLQQLNIQDCQISLEGYRAVKKYCKRCIIEHTNPGFC